MLDKPDWYRAALAARRILVTDEPGNGWRLVRLMRDLVHDPRFAGVWVRHTPDPELYEAFKSACRLYARAPWSTEPEAIACRARRAAFALAAAEQVMACARAADKPIRSIHQRVLADD